MVLKSLIYQKNNLLFQLNFLYGMTYYVCITYNMYSLLSLYNVTCSMISGLSI